MTRDTSGKSMPRAVTSLENSITPVPRLKRSAADTRADWDMREWISRTFSPSPRAPHISAMKPVMRAVVKNTITLWVGSLAVCTSTRASATATDCSGTTSASWYTCRWVAASSSPTQSMNW
jgi:hypothetical protein